MKIAGITWWRNNYGSILQALAFQTIMNNYTDIEYEIINQYGKKINSFDNLLQKLKSQGIIKTTQKIIFRFGIKKLHKRTLVLQHFIDEYLITSKDTYTERTIAKATDYYDGFVCGSDQIWNPSLTSISSMYWLRFAGKDKVKFSYAPSIGTTSLTDHQKKEIADALSSYAGISCREQSGSKLLNSFIKIKCQTVLDPTMVVDRSVWDYVTSKRANKQNYVFAYLLRASKAERKYIEEYAKENSVCIVTIPFLEPDHIVWYDWTFGDIKLWNAGPYDFINAIRYADTVFTDSFHCIIFSILYHKNYFCFPKAGTHQMTRLVELHKMFHINNRILNLTDGKDTIKHFEKVDWETVDLILAQKRADSINYLNSILQEDYKKQ